tara:strand:+ start:2356 stop:2739 length:384 start_codon:yes stop_codon:yes gene_type:complete
MELIAIVTVLVLIQFFLFSYLVGVQRGKHGVKAPAMSGHPEFDRALRIQQNTMEQLVVFIPALWLFGYYVDPRWGAGIGLVFLIGRFVYRAGYLADPAKRHTGFMIGMVAMLALLLGGLYGAIRRLI